MSKLRKNVRNPTPVEPLYEEELVQEDEDAG